MTENQEQYADVKGHQKDPQQRFVSANGGKQKRVMQSPQPSGFFFRINLKRGRVAGFSKYLYQPYRSADKKSGKGHIDHRHQDDIIQRLQNYLPLDSN